MSECPTKNVDEQSAGIVAVGNILSPLFLLDPSNEGVASLYETLIHDLSDVEDSWPFGDCKELKKAFAQIKEGLDKGVDKELISEYRRLFVGPHHLVVPPWGSVYTDYDGVCFGNTTVELSRWLKKKGISFALQSKEAVDHVGIMLALMAYISQFHQALFNEFMEQHYLPWVFHYAELLEAEAKHPFYKGLACLLTVTLEGIQSECHLTPNKVRLYR